MFRLSVNSFYDREPQLEPIIGLPVGGARGLSLRQNWGVVLEEADETVYWLELLVDTGSVKKERLNGLLTEARELVAIFTASHYTMRREKL